MSEIQRAAVLSDDGLYRYRLDRWWGEGPRVVWVMLNPSTADADADDNTIRRCIGFTRRWGYDGLTVVNLYPFRATKPADLKRWMRTRSAYVMTHNNGVIDELVRHAPLVIAAWGANATDKPLPGWHHLGLTKDGVPRHPLFVRGDTEPRAWHRMHDVLSPVLSNMPSPTSGSRALGVGTQSNREGSS